jgi:hypothetical protein
MKEECLSKRVLIGRAHDGARRGYILDTCRASIRKPNAKGESV